MSIKDQDYTDGMQKPSTYAIAEQLRTSLSTTKLLTENDLTDSLRIKKLKDKISELRSENKAIKYFCKTILNGEQREEYIQRFER